MKDLNQIAKTCHAVHLAYCKNIGAKTQPSWEQLSTNHKGIIMDSVYKIIRKKIISPKESHANFVANKIAGGWTYAEEYDATNKKNPRLVTFNELSSEDRLKEELFFAVVKSF